MSAIRAHPEGCDISDDVAAVTEAEDASDLADRIWKWVGLRGFCTLDLGVKSEKLAQALLEIDNIKREGRLHVPHEILLSGLLGDSGSVRIARLLSKDAGGEGPALDSVCGMLNSIGRSLSPSSCAFGFDLRGKTPVFLHEATEHDDAIGAGQLNETDAMEWLDWYTWTRILVLVVIGPSSGVLTLSPNDEDSLPYRIPVEPGMCIVLRADDLQPSLQVTSQLDSEARCYAVGAWFLEHLEKDCWLNSRGSASPGALRECYRELDKWLMDRMDLLCKQRDNEKEHLQDYVAPIPRKLEMAMNSLIRSRLRKQRQTAVKGAAYHFPSMDGTASTKVPLTCEMPGVDLATIVPWTRWDHDLYYSDSPDGIYCKHCSMTDVWEYFDGRFFNISANEIKSMTGAQRKGLETAYAALYEGGETRKSLAKSLTGVYFGTAIDESGGIENNLGVGMFGGDLSVTCGRIGFSLNLMGPMMAIDSEGASSTLAIMQGMNSLHTPVPMNSKALCAGSYTNSNLYSWKFSCTLGYLGRRGRCLSFDANADGLVKSEGCATVYLKSLADEIDGELVKSEGSLFGIASSAVARSDGSKASLMGAPNGPILQELFHGLTNSACISPLDVDAVELHAIGRLMDDAIEVHSALKVFGGGECDRILPIGSVKTGHLSAKEAAGMHQFLKVMDSLNSSAIMPNVHLREINPHMDDLDNLLLSTELMPLRVPSVSKHYCIFSHGLGGSSTGLDLTSVPRDADQSQQEQPVLMLEGMSFSFWPGGSRSVEDGQTPERVYSIIGSWSRWSKSDDMQWDGGTTYGYTLTLGENRYENFQIWFDGKSDKILHPAFDRASSGSAAFFLNRLAQSGSETDVDDDGAALLEEIVDAEVLESTSFSWQLDGRDSAESVASGGAAVFGFADMQRSFAGEHVGKPGDRYRIRLHVAGKFHMVDWHKLPARSSHREQDHASEPSTAQYYVVATWNGWIFEEMQPVESSPGKFFVEVETLTDPGEFQIVRNQDWNQVFWPADAHTDEVAGPDSSASAPWNWHLRGRPGDSFRIEFERIYVNGVDTKQVSWSKL
jgi:polyketide synthase-associated protein